MNYHPLNKPNFNRLDNNSPTERCTLPIVIQYAKTDLPLSPKPNLGNYAQTELIRRTPSPNSTHPIPRHHFTSHKPTVRQITVPSVKPVARAKQCALSRRNSRLWRKRSANWSQWTSTRTPVARVSETIATVWKTNTCRRDQQPRWPKAFYTTHRVTIPCRTRNTPTTTTCCCKTNPSSSKSRSCILDWPSSRATTASRSTQWPWKCTNWRACSPIRSSRSRGSSRRRFIGWGRSWRLAGRGSSIIGRSRRRFRRLSKPGILRLGGSSSSSIMSTRSCIGWRGCSKAGTLMRGRLKIRWCSSRRLWTWGKIRSKSSIINRRGEKMINWIRLRMNYKK